MATPIPTYSQDRTVAAISSYYKFLQKLYLGPDDIIYPPKGGWQSITQDSLASLQKNDTVISLLRSLPYLAHKHDKDSIARATWPINYSNPAVQNWAETPETKWKVQPVIYHDTPSHVICLANGKRDSYYLLLDTERGVIHWGNPDGGKRFAKGQGEDLAVYNSHWWQSEPAFEVEAFFEMLKERFRTMEWMPHPYGASDVWEAEEQGEEHTEALKKIMIDAGWPGDGEGGGWDREQAEKQMEEREDECM